MTPRRRPGRPPARSAAEAIRSLNHATLGQDGLGQPADAYEVLGELSLAASRLPQLLGQVGRWLAAALAAGAAATTAPTPPPPSAAPRPSSPVPAAAPPPSPGTSARPSSNSPPSTGGQHGRTRSHDRRRHRPLRPHPDAVRPRPAPRPAHQHADCAEAAARITWAVAGKTIGVITGEVGTGKTAAIRAAVAWTSPATTSSTSATPPPGSAASSRALSPPSADGPPTAPPPSPPRPGTSWP